jgi:hypothetical protein
MQVRYADTPAQKELKRITAERRQFRTNEYNIGAYGTADVGIHPSIYQTAPWGRRAGPGSNTCVAFYLGRWMGFMANLSPDPLLPVCRFAPTSAVAAERP